MARAPRLILSVKPDDVAKLDALKAVLGVDSRAAVIRKLVRDAAREKLGRNG